MLKLSCVVINARQPTTIDAADGGAPPVVRLSGIGPVDENAVGTMAAGVELEFEHDSDWSGLGEEDDDGEDPDSNSEGYYGNDYPEVMRAYRGMTRVCAQAGGSVPIYPVRLVL